MTPETKITGSATPRAVAALTGALSLRAPSATACTIGDGGSAVWKLTHGIVVRQSVTPGGIHWHIEHDADRSAGGESDGA